jgi:hypothetical protein
MLSRITSYFLSGLKSTPECVSAQYMPGNRVLTPIKELDTSDLSRQQVMACVRNAQLGPRGAKTHLP